MNLSFIIWNGSPEIFSYGQFALRWYGLLFALGFLVSQQILYYIYRKEGKPESQVDTLTIVMVIATILGARLGHVIFYQPNIIWQDPLGILLPFEFTPKFKFTGFLGLASHGGAIGIFLALWLYYRYQFSFSKPDTTQPNNESKAKKKSKFGFYFSKSVHGQSYLHILDRMAIVVAITGAFIRFGNFFNSEIIGKPTDSPLGVVFAHQLSNSIEGNRLSDSPVETFGIVKNTEIKDTMTTPGYVPVQLYLFLKPGVSDSKMNVYLENKLKEDIGRQDEFFYIDMFPPLQYFFSKEDNGTLAAKVPLVGIARHPAQLYESISSLLLFVLLFLIWRKYKITLPEGRIFGVFMVVLWSLRFAYEFLKENQVLFENNLPLNMGQILSIPMFLIGMAVLIRSYKKAPVA